MKNIKFLLDEDEDCNLKVGLLRQIYATPAHEFFYHFNRNFNFNVHRISDLLIRGVYYDYQHPVYQMYHPEYKVLLQFVANTSAQSIVKREISELFVDENDVNFLLNHHPDVDYIVKSSDSYIDFSLILHAEDLMFQMQNFSIDVHDELHKLLQYYE